MMEEIVRMATRQGFVDVFWARLKAARRSGAVDSRKQIYDLMEEEYEAQYGQTCFPSYEAFKKYRNRHFR